MCHDFQKFHDFPTFRADCARLRGYRIVKRLLLQLCHYFQAPFTFQSHKIRSQSREIVKFVKIMAQFFLIVREHVI